jgi:hypothetical protein
MANTLRIKRRVAGGAAGAPSSLKNAELAFNEVDDILYYGKGADGNGDATTIPAIAGLGAFVNLTANQTITGTKTFAGTLVMSGATIDGFSTTGAVTIGGDLTVNGTTTTVNSTTVSVDDKNIELGAVSGVPTDAGADGGGITLKGTTDKTFNWVDATDAWTSSEHLDLASTKAYHIAGTSVLDATTLGSAVVTSSLTTVGTISGGTWQGSVIGPAYGGTGQSTYTDGQLLIGNTTGNTLSKATLTAGSGISIANGNGTITLSATGASFLAGSGLTLDGSTLNVDLKANGGIVLETSELAVDLGASSITGTLAIADGGTGATTASGVRAALDLEVGIDLQAWDADLDTLSTMQSGAPAALALLTSTEVAIIDGGTSATATTLATTDRMVVNDGGTMVQVAFSDLVTFLEDGATSGFDVDGGTFAAILGLGTLIMHSILSAGSISC